MNPTSFSSAIGIPNNVTIGRIINTNGSPSFDVLQKIVQHYSSIINTNWLITGEGSMLVGDASKNETIKTSTADCKGCIDKGKTISVLEDVVGILKEVNQSLKLQVAQGSVGADSQNTPYQQTATG
ncbi:MAG: hypothetical protein NT004_10085 [Bacteroidetes bacterium]|nr:hypothetical protein [Bacteroidota bacterium]